VEETAARYGEFLRMYEIIADSRQRVVPPLLGVGRGADNPSQHKHNTLTNVIESLGLEQILWNDISNRK